MKKHPLILIFSIFFFQTTYGQSLHKDVQETYNFEPSKISKEEQEQKSKLLDAFWEKVTKGKDKYLKELRIELKDTTNPTFFFYDGGHLLLSLTKSKDDYQIALDEMIRSNLKDIDHADYVKTVNFFAQNELNTTDAALKIIPVDTFEAYIPQHAMSLDKGLSLRFMLLPINSNLYMTKIIEKLPSIKDTTTIIAILNFLLYSCTCEGDSVILKCSIDKNQDESIRRYALHLVDLNDVKRHDNSSKYKNLIKKRKQILSRVSDEALDELDDVTKELKEQYKCQ